MAAFARSDIEVSPTSYVDPGGFVFFHQGGVYRAIRPAFADFYRELIESGRARVLTERNGLVPSHISPHTVPEAGCDLVIAHDRVEPATYCVEWCPSMHKASALQTLDLCVDLLEDGLTLQDAYPWNTLFASTRPTFIDLTSIVPVGEGLLWPAYQQFLNFYLRPLELAAAGRWKVARLMLLDQVGGVDTEGFVQGMGAGYALRHPLRASGTYLSAALERRLQANTKLNARLQEKARAQARGAAGAALRRRFLKRLRRRVEGIRVRPPGTTWKGYYDEVEADAEDDTKARTVDRLLGELKPATVLDLGCNVGRYALMAAGHGARVIGIDSSEHCVETLYREADGRRLAVVPLVGEVLSPTPGFGFMSGQFPPLVARARSEVVLCLGLMHHLHINGRQPFENIARMLDALAARAVIFEYVDRTDGNIDRLDHGRPIDYTIDTVCAALGAYFRLTRLPSDRPTRTLVVCER